MKKQMTSIHIMVRDIQLVLILNIKIIVKTSVKSNFAMDLSLQIFAVLSWPSPWLSGLRYSLWFISFSPHPQLLFINPCWIQWDFVILFLPSLFLSLYSLSFGLQPEDEEPTSSRSLDPAWKQVPTQCNCTALKTFKTTNTCPERGVGGWQLGPSQ